MNYKKQLWAFFLVCFVETPIKCLVVLIACLFSPFCRAHPSEYTFMTHTRSLLANMDPVSLPGSSSTEGAILLKANYKLHHCVTVFLPLLTYIVPFTLLYGTFVLQ